MTPRKKKKSTLQSDEVIPSKPFPEDLAYKDLTVKKVLPQPTEETKIKQEHIRNDLEEDEVLEIDPETPRLDANMDCPVCKHPLSEHVFIPMSITLDGKDISGSAIFCIEDLCKYSTVNGEACFTQNFLELLEDSDEK